MICPKAVNIIGGRHFYSYSLIIGMVACLEPGAYSGSLLPLHRRSGGHKKTSLVFKFELDGYIPANRSTALRAGSEKSRRHALFPDAGEGGAYSHLGCGQVRLSLQGLLSGLRDLKKANRLI